MSNSDHSRSGQTDTYLARLAEQFERINQLVENGATARLDLAEGGRSISLTIDRDNVAAVDSPPGRSPRRTPPLTGGVGAAASSADAFSFDLGDVNRRVGTDEVASRINRAARAQTDARPGRRTRPTALSSGAAAPGLPNPSIRYAGGVWTVTEDGVYTTNDGFRITVKSGFETDLASVPRIFWALIASFELTIAAPVFHDLIYRSAGEVRPPDGEVAPADKVFTREEADDIFLELMTRAKVSYWKRNVAYLAVRHFAEDAWRKLRAG